MAFLPIEKSGDSQYGQRHQQHKFDRTLHPYGCDAISSENLDANLTTDISSDYKRKGHRSRQQYGKCFVSGEPEDICGAGKPCRKQGAFEVRQATNR